MAQYIINKNPIVFPELVIIDNIIDVLKNKK